MLEFSYFINTLCVRLLSLENGELMYSESFLTFCFFFQSNCNTVRMVNVIHLHFLLAFDSLWLQTHLISFFVHQVNGCLSYFDKIPDGFYQIHGMDPYVWTVCTDLQENGRIPSIESLKSADTSGDPSLEVVLIDRRSDPSLKELQNRVHSISCNCITTKEVVDQLAKLVCNRMG